PLGWTLLATGKKVSEKPLTPGLAAEEQVERWVAEKPLPVAGFNLGKYRRATAQAGGGGIESYATAGVENDFPRAPVESQPSAPFQRKSAILIPPAPLPSPAQYAQAVADTGARAVDFFAKRFCPYPYERLALTQKPGVLSQGWPGLVFLSSFAFLSDAEKSRLSMDSVSMVQSNNVIAHETAHQWWGDLVGWGGYRDQWIVEALSEYSALMMLE